jgi:hypothetical protein
MKRSWILLAAIVVAALLASFLAGWTWDQLAVAGQFGW